MVRTHWYCQGQKHCATFSNFLHIFFGPENKSDFLEHPLKKDQLRCPKTSIVSQLSVNSVLGIYLHFETWACVTECSSKGFFMSISRIWTMNRQQLPVQLWQCCPSLADNWNSVMRVQCCLNREHLNLNLNTALFERSVFKWFGFGIGCD